MVIKIIIIYKLWCWTRFEKDVIELVSNSNYIKKCVLSYFQFKIKVKETFFGIFFTVNLNRPLNWKSMWGWYKASFWAEFWDFFWFHRVEKNFKLVCNWSKINFRCLQKSKFYFFILNVEVFAISSSSTIENGDVGEEHTRRELPI